MSRSSARLPVPPCYALVIDGLESIAAEEIKRRLKGEVKKTENGLVVFRVDEIDTSLLQLKTTEDIFLMAWGTDQLTYRAGDLDRIRRWTAHEVNWDQLLRLHHAVRPKPKGKPTYRLVAQMEGQHVYRRVDARDALAEGLSGKLPGSWRHAEENASVEIWLTIRETRAVCGVRLSDKTMRHRKYKLEHVAASLRPTLAAAMVHLSETRRGMTVLDPMCGAGTILAEQLDAAREMGKAQIELWGGDEDHTALQAAAANLRRLGPVTLTPWDARSLPVPDASVDRIITNPPFGKQLSSPEKIGPLYRRMIEQYDRVLKANARAVILVGEFTKLKDAARLVGWKLQREVRVRVLGQRAWITVWRKPAESPLIPPSPVIPLNEPE